VRANSKKATNKTELTRDHGYELSRPSTSLHFFGGKPFAASAPDWHSDVPCSVRGCSFVTKVTAPISNDSASASASTSTSCLPTINTTTSRRYWFRVEGIRTFPSRRNNLMVGSFWMRRLVGMNCMRTFVTLPVAVPTRVESYCTDRDEWIPHVTLANVCSGGRRNTTTGPPQRSYLCLI
jgi:hypothetical protein